MKHPIIAVLTLVFSFTVYAKDADDFFLLDTEQSCLTNEYLNIDQLKAYRQTPGELDGDKFMVFENDTNAPSDINDIQTLKERLEQFFDENHENLGQAYQDQLLSKITPQSLINILKSILKDDEELENIAKRSYIHVMGFTKMVFLVGDQNKEYKLRLHLWWPDQISGATQLILEDKHVHKWDFASKMFSGSFEDQLYLISDVRPPEAYIYQKFSEAVEKLDEADQKKVFDSLNVIEMSMYGNTKFQNAKFRCSIDKANIYNKKQLQDKFNLNENDFITILSVHESYVTKPNITGEYGLAKIGLKHLSFPIIYDIKEGLSYFHHHDLGHRLISDPDEMVATLVITAPPVEAIEPFILMRAEDGEDITKVAPILDKKELIRQINLFIEHLESKMAMPEAAAL